MIRVLVVDDSLFMRTLVSDMLNSDPQIEVADTAKTGEEAVEKILGIRPNCVTLDLVMPGWDGLTTLEHIMAECPAPVIILSAHSRKDADITIKCLNTGAVGFVLKPSGELSLDIESVKTQLLEQVKAAAKARMPERGTRIVESAFAKATADRRGVWKRKTGKFRVPPVPSAVEGSSELRAGKRIIVIGASTGGPKTLEAILSSLPADFSIPVIVVQHMPTMFFSESLAEHLNRVSELEVKLAENNEIIQARKVYLIPCGFRMRLKPQTTNPLISLSKEQPDPLSPSIDITMKSVAQTHNGNTIGVILSGMGDDGQEGMKAIKESGGKTIVQDESSLIFGMPKAVIDAGYADKVLSTYEIAEEMVELAGR